MHGTSEGLKTIDEIAAFTGPKGHYVLSDLRTPALREFRVASMWRRALPGIDRPRRGTAAYPESAVAGVREAEAKLHDDDLEAAHEILERTIAGGKDPVSVRLRVEGALLFDRLGMTRTALSHVSGVETDDPLALAALGWALAEMGDDANACRVAMKAIDRDDVRPSILHLWRALWARYTRTEWATGSVDEIAPLAARLLAQVACARSRLQVADDVITAVAGKTGLSAAVVSRIQADVRLESPNAVDWRDAAARYESILADAATGVVDRADALYNIGVIHERFGQVDAAIEQYRKALATNPLLEPAADRLAALGAAG